jgi:Spy/CpxP family protein refolding chaperone
MKYLIPLTAAALLLLCLPATLHAQDAPQAPAQAESAPARTPEQAVNFYALKLGLSDVQKTQLKPILAERQQKMADLRADTSSRPREKLRKMKSITEDSDKKINAVLTPEQQKKYTDLEEQMKEQARERRQQKKQGSSN